MNVTQIPIPGSNFFPKRQYYNPYRANFGKPSTVRMFVYHWIVGTQRNADQVFTRQGAQVSAHASFEGSQVNQYVRLDHVAYHAGNSDVNAESVGLEISAQPGRDATDETYESVSRFVAQAARLQGRKVGDYGHVRHNEIVPTACPGTVDVGRIVLRAMEIEAQETQQQAILASVTTVVPVSVPVKVVSRLGLNVRKQPTTASPVVRAIRFGDTAYVTGSVDGFVVEGNATWLRLEDGNYVWSGATDWKPRNNQS